MTNLEGRVIHRRRVAPPPGGVRGDLDILRELAERLASAEVRVRRRARRLRRAAARHRGRRRPTTAASPTSGSTRAAASSGRARRGTTPARRGCSPIVSPTPTAARASCRSRIGPPAKSPTTTTRSTSRPAATRSTTTPARRRARVVPWSRPVRSRSCRSTRGSRQRLGVATASGCVESRRGAVEFEVEVTADVRPDTLFCPFHWGGKQAANRLTNPPSIRSAGCPNSSSARCESRPCSAPTENEPQ